MSRLRDETAPTRPLGRHRRAERLDIQGLRALAVGVVIANHLLDWPAGGFVGVDVFFVISGFLITHLLVREHERTGRISFTGFYRRRIKRILPAASLVVLVTVAAARLLFLGERMRQVLLDGAYAMAFSANWHFAANSTDYFQRDRPPSPLQHYWSLSVEEQFYLVWPWVLLAVLAVVATRSRRTRLLAASAAISALGVVSFGWALHETTTSPRTAYFSTFSRGWELAAGALLALAAPACARLPDRWRPPLAWAGLAAIALALIRIGQGSAFPAPAAAIPVLATAMVIAAGTYTDPGRQQRFVWPLTNPVARYVGDISFSLYLWHFPVLVLGAAVLPADTATHRAVFGLLTLVLAVAGYHLVEQPVRRSPLLVRFPDRDSRRSAYADWAAHGARPLAVALTGALTLTAVTTAGYALVSPGDVRVAAPDTHYRDAGRPARPGRPSAEQRLAHDIEVALRARSWPRLDPSLEEVVAQRRPPAEDAAGCGDSVPADPTSCSFGDPHDPTMMVLGDSTAIALIPTVRAAFGDRYHIRGLTKASCQIAVAKKYHVQARRRSCRAHTRAALAEVARSRPAVVFVSDVYDIADRLASGATGAAATAEWRSSMQALVDRLRDSARRVVVVSPAVQGEPLEKCATRLSTPQDCVGTIPETYRIAQAAESLVTGPGVHYLDTSWWFCDDHGRCPPFVGDTPVRRDAVHISERWALKMAPFFANRVRPWLEPTHAGG